MDREAQRLIVTFVEPVQPELVHIRYDPPSRQDRVGREHSTSRVAQVIKTLTHRRAVVAFALLRQVEIRSDIFELTKNLRDWLLLFLVKNTNGQVGRACSTRRARALDGEFRPKRKNTSFRAVLTALFIAPCVVKELLNERGFSGSLPQVLPRCPCLQPLEKSGFFRGAFEGGIFEGPNGPKERLRNEGAM